MLVLGLEPAPPAGLVECGRVALQLEDILSRLGMRCVPKTSGSGGLHLCVPLDLGAEWEETRAFARSLSSILARRNPELVAASLRREDRRGRVLVDWRPNAPHRALLAPYSLRASPRPTVSTPLAWPEVQDAVTLGEPGLLVFEPYQVLDRIRRFGDLATALLRPGARIPVLQGGRAARA